METVEDWKKQYQVCLDPRVYAKIEGIARIREMTVEEWVDEALRKAAGDSPEAVEARLQAIQEIASRYQFPMEEIEEMVQEIHGNPIVK